MADRWSRRTRTDLASAAALMALLLAPTVGATQDPGSAAAERGRMLFAGAARFAKGGPPCGACHSAAGLPFPGGGTMGPDLTDAYSKYGPEPLGIVLTTLFFPTMNPVFAGRPLTAAERGDLVAFLAASVKQPPPAGTTLRTFLLGLLVFVGLAIVIALLGRSRLRGVRAPLVRAARRRLREARP